jgi:hypothetical protein
MLSVMIGFLVVYREEKDVGQSHYLYVQLMQGMLQVVPTTLAQMETVNLQQEPQIVKLKYAPMLQILRIQIQIARPIREGV